MNYIETNNTIMPIAQFLVKKDVEVSADALNNIVIDISQTIGVDEKDICLNVINDFLQAGQQYKVFVNLYLPSLWFPKDSAKVQLIFLETIVKYLSVIKDDVFIITTIVEPGNVVENGDIIDW
ncbi:MAG TPA: hypothetical protein VL947_10250 [Cytophagales bacterium]|nr:hypothetical protein [Cytophagales bacterium]